MQTRVITVAVIAFWLASMGWLCAVVWAPPESRMAEVDPREIYEVFFAWNERTTMTLLENGSRRGELIVAGGSGEDRKSGEFLKSVSLSGTIDTIDPAYDMPGIDLHWKGLADFDREINFLSGEFSVRMPGRNLSAFIGIEGDPAIVKASVMMSQIPILQYDSSKGSLDTSALGSLPFSSLLGDLDPAMLTAEIEARMGTFSFGGRDLRAYLLILKGKEREESLRVFLSEVGEPLRIESDFGFEAVSEILVPLDAYLKESETGSND